MNLKIADFGVSKVAHAYTNTFCGTPYYISPEIINQMPYSLKTDVWSLGVVLYEISTRKMPFNGDSLNLLSYQITKGNYKGVKGYPRIESIIRKMLVVNPNNRYLVGDLMKDPVFSNISSLKGDKLKF